MLPLPPDTWARDTSTATLLTRGLHAALAGESLLARRCLAAVRARPARELVPQGDAPTLLDAQIEILARRPEQAVRLLRPVAVSRAVYNDGIGLDWPRWVLAGAFEQLGQPDSAAFYLERIWSVPFRYYPHSGAYAHHRLALLYARLGRPADAERHLLAVEKAWDHADPPVRRMLEETRASVRGARGMARPERP